jgi:signal transduction histidine kinase
MAAGTSLSKKFHRVKTKKIHLLRKTSQSFLAISAMLMVLSTVCLYFVVSRFLQAEIEEELYSTEDRVANLMKHSPIPPNMPPVIEVREVETLKPEFLKDTVIYDPSQDEMELFHELSKFRNISGRNYQITIRALVVESEDILIAIVISYMVILVLAFLFLFYFNKSRNRSLWSPFFTNLDQMKQFTLAGDAPIKLAESNIVEFTELNREIAMLTDRVRQDYQNLKQFTENISHEIQTPLAIIQAKIDNMMNVDNLNNPQFEHLASIQKDIHRLTQLNKKLALLTKIENRQFNRGEVVNIAELVQETIDNFREMSPAEILFVKGNEIHIRTDLHLATALCTNLISNAIKYHSPGSAIKIAVSGQTLRVANRGEVMLKQPEKVFGRFYREDTGQRSTGLGLAIVKKICDLYGYQLGYTFEDGCHTFTVDFGVAVKIQPRSRGALA